MADQKCRIDRLCSISTPIHERLRLIADLGVHVSSCFIRETRINSLLSGASKEIIRLEAERNEARWIAAVMLAMVTPEQAAEMKKRYSWMDTEEG